MECSALYILCVIIYAYHHIPIVLFTMSSLLWFVLVCLHIRYNEVLHDDAGSDNASHVSKDLICGLMSNSNNDIFPTNDLTLKGGAIPAGLQNTKYENLGYFNAVLQSISATPNLLETIEQSITAFHSRNIEIVRMIFLMELRDVIKKLITPDNYTTSVNPFIAKLNAVSTRSLRTAMRNFCQTRNTNNLVEDSAKQQDFAQYFQWFSEVVHEALRIESRTAGIFERTKPGNEWCTGLLGTQVKSRVEQLMSSFLCPSVERVIAEKEILYQQLHNANALDAMIVCKVAEIDFLLHKNRSCSFVEDLFTGQCVKAYTCTGCHRLRICTEVFRIFSMSIPTGCQSLSIKEFFEQHQVVEATSEVNRPTSCQCMNHSSIAALPECVQQESVSYFPECLAVELARFTDGKQDHCKVQVSVEPIDLSFLTSVKLKEQEPVVYMLYGACVRSSDMGSQSAHAYAYSKSADESWNMFDDEFVKKVDMVEELKKTEVEENVSLLLYKKLLAA